MLPPYLAERLPRDPHLHGCVLNAFASYKQLMDFSHVPFFQDYTDHGFSHVLEVLAAADWLILPSEDVPVTAADACVLCLAVLLHDAALHITEDGFQSLVRGEYPWAGVGEFRDEPWELLWREFLREAKRWDARKRVSLFGTDVEIKTPPADALDYTASDRLLIGEFLRRNHPRIAHEIARAGFPGPDGQTAFSLEGVLDPPMRDLVGLVARSHGMPLRATFDYLEQYYDLREFRNVHCVYLMVLLRIADYIQIQASRAPNGILEVKNLRSPLSRAEWGAHRAITNVTTAHPDAEALSVTARPPDVHSYLKVTRLLDGLQSELDLSWAVLGEVYARVPPLDKLRLKLRRVRSNLEDENRFARTVTYVPRHAAFKSAGADLLKLLISPLYGETPEAAVRELVQNAVDAVIELRNHLQLTRRKIPALSRRPHVTVSLSKEVDGNWWLIVTDKGIGMTADVICNYFLNAGASYRDSDEWKRMHTDDETRHSLVLRTGRFGIGLLAVFILGEEIDVETRHVDATEDSGFRFTAAINDETIEIQRVHCALGTTIRVRLNEMSVARLIRRETRGENGGAFQIVAPEQWDWYCYQDPVVRRLAPNGKPLPQAAVVPGPDQESVPGWRRTPVLDRGMRVDWTFGPAPALVVNGIKVVERWSKEIPSNSLGFPIPFPKISVSDPNAQMPLAIHRQGLTTELLPFEERLIEEVARDYLAYGLASAPTRAIIEEGELEWYLDPQYMGYSAKADLGMWLSGPDGTCPTDPWILADLNLSSLLIVPVRASDPILPRIPLDEPSNSILLPVDALGGGSVLLSLTSSIGSHPLAPYGLFTLPFFGGDPLLAAYEVKGVRVLRPLRFSEEDQNDLPSELQANLAEFRSRFERSRTYQRAEVLETGDCENGSFVNAFTSTEPAPWPRIGVQLFLQRRAAWREALGSPTAIAASWLDLARGAVIPYSPKARPNVMQRMYGELERHMRAHTRTHPPEQQTRATVTVRKTR